MARWLAGLGPEVRRVLWVDVTATSLFTVFVVSTGPYTGLILRGQFHATAFQLSLIASAGGAVGLLGLLWSRLMTGHPPLPWATWPGFVARSLYLAVPFLRSAWSFVGVLAASNMIASVAAPAEAAVASRVYPPEQRGRALGVVSVISGLAAIGVTPLAARLLAILGYRWLFSIAGLVGMAGSLSRRHMIVPVLAETADSRRTMQRPSVALRRDTALRRALVAMFIFGTGVWLQIPAQPIMLVDVLHVSVAQVALFSAVAAIVGLIATASWGYLVDRRSSVTTLRVVFLVGLVEPVVYLTAQSAWAVILAWAASSALATGLDLVWIALLLDIAGPSRAATYVAIAATAAGVRAVAVPLLSGVLITTIGPRGVYAVAAALMGLGLGALIANPPRLGATQSRSSGSCVV